MDDATLDAFADWERTSWETRAQAYAADIGVLTRGGVEPLLDAAAVRAGTRVLDVATGPGFVAEAAHARGAVVEAVDQSQAMVAIASERLPWLTVHQAPAEQLGRPDASYDAVVAGFLLNHLARPAIAVAELVRVLASDGRLALSVWAEPAANRVMGLLGEVIAELGLTGAVPAGPDSTLFADSRLFEDLLVGAGLQDVTIDRTSWSVAVEPGAWFDAVAKAMPRSGAVLSQVDDAQRDRARTRFVARSLEEHAVGGGMVSLQATAVVGSGRKA